MDLDVRHFHDADLVTPMEFDSTAAFEYGIERLRTSETLRSVGQIVPPPYVCSIHEQALAGDLEAEIASTRPTWTRSTRRNVPTRVTARGPTVRAC
jgi:hypothetical protein